MDTEEKFYPQLPLIDDAIEKLKADLENTKNLFRQELQNIQRTAKLNALEENPAILFQKTKKKKGCCTIL